MEVRFKTIPQAPLSTIEKIQLISNNVDESKLFTIKILFVDVDVAKKWGNIRLTFQILDGDMPYIFKDDYKVRLHYDGIIIYNYNPIYNILRPLLVEDGLLDKFDNGAIIIPKLEIKRYLKGRFFTVQGRNLSNYKNSKACPMED